MAGRIFEPMAPDVERVGRRLIGAAIAVHGLLGPGYKEPIYVEALCIELDLRALSFERVKSVIVSFKDREVGALWTL
jgi:GxxExxY protein